jgi:hypothetical protein
MMGLSFYFLNLIFLGYFLLRGKMFFSLFEEQDLVLAQTLDGKTKYFVMITKLINQQVIMMNLNSVNSNKPRIEMHVRNQLQLD